MCRHVSVRLNLSARECAKSISVCVHDLQTSVIISKQGCLCAQVSTTHNSELSSFARQLLLLCCFSARVKRAHASKQANGWSACMYTPLFGSAALRVFACETVAVKCNVVYVCIMALHERATTAALSAAHVCVYFRNQHCTMCVFGGEWGFAFWCAVMRKFLSTSSQLACISSWVILACRRTQECSSQSNTRCSKFDHGSHCDYIAIGQTDCKCINIWRMSYTSPFPTHNSSPSHCTYTMLLHKRCVAHVFDMYGL